MQEIGVVMYAGAQQAAILGLTDLFAVANRVAEAHSESTIPAIKVTHWQQDDADSAPYKVFDSYTPAASTGLAALILPPALGEPLGADDMPALQVWLRKQHAAGVVLTSVCAGAFALAATGLVKQRRMTTHWSHAELLHQRFPDVIVDADQLIIDDGDIITAGGLMAWTDLGLRLVDRLLGSSVMIATARLEERTFLRRFQKATGMTTTEYCQRLRVGRARELLQFGNASIDRIAWEVGYSDPSAFRKVFTRIVGLAPSDYRRRFNAKASPAA